MALSAKGIRATAAYVELYANDNGLVHDREFQGRHTYLRRLVLSLSKGLSCLLLWPGVKVMYHVRRIPGPSRAQTALRQNLSKPQS